MLHICIQMLHQDSCKQVQIKHFCHIPLPLERPGASTKTSPFCQNPLKGRELRHLNILPFLFWSPAATKCPQAFQEDVARWERVEQRHHFWSESLQNICCAPSTIKPKDFAGHQQRGSSSKEVGWKCTAGRSGLHQLAELPSEGQTCFTSLEIPDKLRFTPSRHLEPTWWPSRCT